jgi:hypothetical protein
MEESTMPVTISRRSLAARAVAATATVAAAVGGFALMAPSADAGTSTLFTVTKLSVHRLPASTANQVITLTGTGFDEDLLKSVTINGCTTAPSYVVSSPTSLLVKTAADCVTSSTGVITLTDTSNDTYATVPGTTGGAQALAFIAAPTIATASATVKPVVTENSVAGAFADQQTTANTKGGTVVRVKAGATPFVNSTTYPLAASLSGVALTKVTMPVGGAYLTGVLGAHAPDAAPVLKVTSNGVSKSFSYGAGGASATAGTHDFKYAGTSIAVSPATGPLSGGVLTITGSGFSTTAANNTVTVGGVSCPVSGTPTATVVKCTAAAVTSPGAKDVKVVTSGTGGQTTVVGATSTFTYLSE